MRTCRKSHDLDDVLDVEEAAKTKRKRKRHSKSAVKQATGDSGALDGEAHGEEGTYQSRCSSTLIPAAAPTSDSSFAGRSGSSKTIVAASFAVEPARDVADPIHAEVAVDEGQSATFAGSRSQGHRAGFDAFMTGYCFAHYQSSLDAAQLASAKNKLYLSAKPFPLNILKSQYVKTSEHHQEKQRRMTGSSTS